jgi:hypothetical protein
VKIALDYDKTYTVDPPLWDRFIQLARLRGHEVVSVTMRTADMPVPAFGSPPVRVIYTAMQAKARHYQADIWIDDMPQRIFANDAA